MANYETVVDYRDFRENIGCRVHLIDTFTGEDVRVGKPLDQWGDPENPVGKAILGARVIANRAELQVRQALADLVTPIRSLPL